MDSLRALLDASDELLMLVRASDLSIGAANRRACEALGRGEGELTAMTITEIECGLQDVFFWAEVPKGNWTPLHDAETVYARADGSTLAVERSVLPVPGDAALISVRARDVGARAIAESAIERTASLLAATFESTADALLVVDLAGRILNFNERFATLFQIPDALLAERNDRRVFRHLRARLRRREDFARLARLLADRGGEAADTIELGDGRTIECRSRPHMLHQQVLGRVYSLSDITERIRHQRELAAARDEALAASRAKSEFLATMSHEFRTPMNGILGATQLLLAGPLDSSTREWAETCKDGAESLLNLVSDILDYAKGEASGFEFERIPYQPRQMLDRALRLFRGSAQDKGLEIRASVDAALPKAGIGDPNRLRQIFNNLLSNAIKFTAQGRIDVSLFYTARMPGDGVLRCEVQDSGIGIPPAKLETIFEPFRQADSNTSRRYGGTGLGLTICRQLAQGMGGRIWAENGAAGGARFVLELPFLAASDAPGSDPTPADRPPKRICQVLVADDNAVNRMIACRFLEKLGHRGHAVSNGREAIEAVSAGGVDLALLDLEMPELDGIGAAHAIRRLPDPQLQATPLVALSASEKSGIRDACRRAGIDAYLEKPLRLNQLATLMERLASGAPLANPQNRA